ncbi:hypothetical protein SLEP1_g6462 [Rubroshorea leprosula]|uniref:Uncharacterized protein n=1 Tax=Rubroshorea leprosula TaxID=152421 RepID=A0AAV5I632_9ROSI|nr:hypothetical protein SLEP1_g6462 [Rubroshorea leprosula]
MIAISRSAIFPKLFLNFSIMRLLHITFQLQKTTHYMRLYFIQFLFRFVFAFEQLKWKKEESLSAL